MMKNKLSLFYNYISDPNLTDKGLCFLKDKEENKIK